MARLANLLNRVQLQFPQASLDHLSHTHGPPSPPTLYHDDSNSAHLTHKQPKASNEISYENSTLDFCNAFWGESGYEVLMSRVKQSSKLLEDLKIWYKERCSIELEYSKKLARISKSPVLNQPTANLESIGLKSALESIRQSTEKSAHSHAELSGTFKTALYDKFSDFINARDSIKKHPQATVEKLHKIMLDLKVLHEKARRKYEADAIANNGYVTQLQLVQGRDSDKVLNKLEKVQMSVKITEKEYRNHNKNLQDTTNEWNTQWKLFCDIIQDLEEDRIDFVRNTFWDYANAISAICVAEDEQCESIRKSLEHCDVSKDIRSYVRQAATGNEYTFAPSFVDYTAGESPRPVAVLTANFIRTTNRKSEDTTLVPLSKPLQGMIQSIQAGPPILPETSQNPNATTIWENKNKMKRGGAIAEAVASQSLNTNQNINQIQLKNKAGLTVDNLNYLQRRLGHSNGVIDHNHVGHPSGQQQNYEPINNPGQKAYLHQNPRQQLSHQQINLGITDHNYHSPLINQNFLKLTSQSQSNIVSGDKQQRYWPLTPVNLNDRPLPAPPT